MACQDSEVKHWIQKIMPITFRVAKDLPPNTITRKRDCKVYFNRSEEFMNYLFIW